MEKLAVPHPPKISISVVSHKQINLVANLLHDLTQYCHVLTFEFILTLRSSATAGDCDLAIEAHRDAVHGPGMSAEEAERLA